MKCEFCGTNCLRGIKVKNNKGKIVSLTFCCYECYLAFWKNVEGFIPLSNAESVIAPEPIKKKRIQLKKHISYKKSAYCF